MKIDFLEEIIFVKRRKISSCKEHSFDLTNLFYVPFCFKICKDKKFGGSGIRRLEVLNRALLGKWLGKWFRYESMKRCMKRLGGIQSNDSYPS